MRGWLSVRGDCGLRGYCREIFFVARPPPRTCTYPYFLITLRALSVFHLLGQPVSSMSK